MRMDRGIVEDGDCEGEWRRRREGSMGFRKEVKMITMIGAMVIGVRRLGLSTDREIGLG